MTQKQNPSCLSFKLHRHGRFRFLLVFALTAATIELYSAPLCNAAPSLVPRQHIAHSIPSMSNVTSSSSSQLQAIVERAVNDSISALGDNVILNSNNMLEFVNRVVKNLVDAGITAPLQCKPKPGNALKQQFLSGLRTSTETNMTIHDDNACLRLDEVPELGDNGYILTTSSACKDDISINLTCFGSNNQQNQCFMKTTFKTITEESNYFPRYMLQMTCSGCSPFDTECLVEHRGCYADEKRQPFHLLKRVEGQCDENGFEQWQRDDTTQHAAVVACGCLKATTVV